MTNVRHTFFSKNLVALSGRQGREIGRKRSSAHSKFEADGEEGSLRLTPAMAAPFRVPRISCRAVPRWRTDGVVVPTAVELVVLVSSSLSFSSRPSPSLPEAKSGRI